MAKSKQKIQSVNGKKIRRSVDGVYSIVWTYNIIKINFKIFKIIYSNFFIIKKINFKTKLTQYYQTILKR